MIIAIITALFVAGLAMAIYELKHPYEENDEQED